MNASRDSKPPYSRISAHMEETRIVTRIVSNMPEAPLPMLPRSAIASTVPVASVMTMPEKMPMSRTTNTFQPMIPPMRTST